MGTQRYLSFSVPETRTAVFSPSPPAKVPEHVNTNARRFAFHAPMSVPARGVVVRLLVPVG